MQKSKPDALECLLQTCAMSRIYSALSSKRLLEEPLERTCKKAAMLKELWQEGTSYLHCTSIHLIDDQLQHNEECGHRFGESQTQAKGHTAQRCSLIKPRLVLCHFPQAQAQEPLGGRRLMCHALRTRQVG